MIYLIKLSSFSSCWNLAQCRQIFFLILFIATFQFCEQGLTKKVGFGPGVVAYIFNPALRKKRLANLYGLKPTWSAYESQDHQRGKVFTD